VSTFEDRGYKWRETYFVLFDSERRPTLDALRDSLEHLSGRFELLNPAADEAGRIESLTLHSPQDYAALDISYVEGGEVLEQGAILAKELKGAAADATEKAKVARLAKCTARFDVLHFEEVVDETDDEGEMLDPSALLLVLGTLAKLTHGVGIDPQSGTVM
jgi:hypothetical protein